MYKIKLSPYHKIFYNEWKLDPLSSKYNIVFDQTISSTLDIPRLKNALYRFVSDYLIINSHVQESEGELYWVKNTEIVELEHFVGSYTLEQIYNYVSKPFDILSGPLYRFVLFTEVDGTFRFILVFHHLLIDGSSFNILISEISKYYNLFTYKLVYSLVQQENMLRNNIKLLDQQLDAFGNIYKRFWEKYLNNVNPLDLRWLKSEVDISNIKEYRFNIRKKAAEKLKSITKMFDTTVYNYCQCIFAILLYKYTAQNKFGISYPVAIKGGMPLMLGSQVNTNIYIYEFNSKTKIIDLFKQNKKFIQLIKSVGDNASYYPINKIMNNVNNDLLDIMVAQTNLKDKPFNLTGVKTININSEFNIDLPVKIIIELEMLEGSLNFRIRYDALKIDEIILKQFITSYNRIFMAILDDLNINISNKRVEEYLVLNESEYNKIVYEWNRTKELQKSNKTIQELFELQVSKTPDNIAMVYGDTKLTYSELNNYANQLSHYLKANYNIKGDDLIALFLNRSQYMLIAILGIIKAGAAYVPIDIKCPRKRICYILDDIKTKVLIADNSCHDYILGEIIPSHKFDILNIENPNTQRKLKQQLIDNPRLTITNKNLVYVMYTSGTTGTPKGVMIEHYSAVTRVMSMIKKSGINSKSKYLFKTNYTFDVSFSDMFMSLFSGAALYITKSIFDVDEINNLITKNNINFCHFVPSQLELINDYPDKKDIFSRLQTINLSGEKFKKSLINKNANIRYINYYGPTEAGEVSYDITDFKNRLVNHEKLTTIGHPLNQSTLYILDKYLKPVPIGALGELYIGGAGLARGYLNLPQLTDERFISNPFQSEQEKAYNWNSRLYKTGDLVRYLSDGNIEYIGRMDNQIKVDGVRIELDEIEAKLSNFSGIEHAVVLYLTQPSLKSRNDQYLVAYYVSKTKINENLIIEYLVQELPEYMIPRAIIWLNKLPLTRHGKLDIESLPQANFILNNTNNYKAPRNELEHKICAIYADVLGLETDKVGINNSFFKLGGDSILAIRLMFKLQHYFNVTVNNIFEFKTPAKIAQYAPSNNINLVDKLEEVKSVYLKLELDKTANNILIDAERSNYQKQAKLFKFNNENKSDSKILLTGVTGYLGCHILYQLLSTTNHLVYLPIRGNSQEVAYTRLLNKFKYYFDIDLDLFYDRIVVFLSDISKENLGLDKSKYEELINNTDSIIHSAAKVKFYGNSSDSYLQNVQATINLLELAKTTNKDFHYISTIGVFTDTQIGEKSYNIFTENGIDATSANLEHIYKKTKYQGEQVTLKYREYGVKTNIYRVGNLAANSVTHKIMENTEDNAFFQYIKTILKLGIIPQELSEVDISPVDCTAAAIVALSNLRNQYNQIYHVFNPKKSDLYKLLHKNKSINIERVTFPEFIDTILIKLRNSDSTNQIEIFMLYQGWLQPNIRSLAKTVIFQDKTNHILKQLKFKWPSITNKMLSNMIKKAKISLS